MLTAENRYAFRLRLLEVHKSAVRDYAEKPRKHEFSLVDGAVLALPECADAVLWTAAKDFIDYMFVSQGVAVGISGGGRGDVEFALLPSGEITNAKRMECNIEIGDRIKISAYHARGLAQGLYKLEHTMNVRRAPFLNRGVMRYAPLFSPRMVHSAYGMDIFPNEYLSHLAHNGIDAILVSVCGVDKTSAGYTDFNELISRAEKYGIDVYAYSHLKSRMHPDEACAEQFYDALYGSVFKNSPGFAGVVLVGESVLFPSRDPDTNGLAEWKDEPHDIPSDKPSPGWWPCRDYPRLVERIRDSVRKYSPKADIVFWTYNWGYAPEEHRIRLIRSLPTDISLLVTFEMFEKYQMQHIEGYCADYTLSFAGPGKYYVSEAEAAAACGIRLYAMSNTAGKTWDFGSVPYLPMPYQWMKRYEGLKQSHAGHGLSGLMESHTYGLYPSFISELANAVMCQPDAAADDVLTEILLVRFGKAHVSLLKRVFALWSEAITYYTPSNEDQYGAFRIGPAYPFCFTKKFLPKPSVHAMYGSSIVMPDYEFPYLDFSPPPSLRTRDELAYLTRMQTLIDKGLSLLADVDVSGNTELERLVNLGKYISHTVWTGINVKNWQTLKTAIRTETKREKIRSLLAQAKAVLESEIKNAEAALPLVRTDSAFGYEPSMDYLGDAEHIEWKIRQVRYVIDTELRQYENRMN